MLTFHAYAQKTRWSAVQENARFWHTPYFRPFRFFVTNIRTSCCTFTGINNMGWCTKIIDMSYGREPYFYALLSSDPQLYFAFICYSHSSLLVMDKKRRRGRHFLWNPHFHHRRRSTNISTTNIGWNSWRQNIKMEHRQWHQPRSCNFHSSIVENCDKDK